MSPVATRWANGGGASAPPPATPHLHREITPRPRTLAIFIVDRKKDMVLRGGENVYCAEVEAALYRHPAVAEACVFGVPDERLGEEVGAAVWLQGSDIPTAETLRAHVRELLAAFKVPRHIWIVTQPLPRNATGKIQRKQLRAELLASADSSEG